MIYRFVTVFWDILSWMFGIGMVLSVLVIVITFWQDVKVVLGRDE